MDHDDWFDEIIKKISDSIDSSSEWISHGGAETIKDYAGTCGLLKGYRESIEIVKEIKNKYYRD